MRTIRAPLAPIGWPSATAPPFTFTISGSTSSMRALWIGTAANASLISRSPSSDGDRPAFFSARSAATAGTVWSDGNRSADIP